MLWQSQEWKLKELLSTLNLPNGRLDFQKKMLYASFSVSAAHSCSLLQEANGDPTSWIPEFAHCLSLSSVHGLKRSKAMKHLAACGRNDVEKDFSWWRGYEAIGATISDSADTLKTCPFRLLAFQSFCVGLDFASFATPPRFEFKEL